MHCYARVAIIAATVCTSLLSMADEPTVRERVSSKDMEALVETLISDRNIVTDLNVRLVDSQTMFDVTSKPNTDELPWLIQVNVSDREFKVDSKKYVDDGFEMPIHRVVSVGRRKLHSAVWVQTVSRAAELILPEGDVPQTGEPGRNWAPLNELIRKTLQDHNIPGATLAVAHHGTLLFERGFGYSDVEQATAMVPNATMRIASVSKPITALAILILVDQGKLELDKPVLEYLASHPFDRFKTEHATEADARWRQVTVRHLLQHSGGMDRDQSRDTMFQLIDITKAQKLNRLARIPDVVRYQLKQPLEFDPGSRHAYSNVGYCLLGRIVEAVTGQHYEEFIQASILEPAGMTQTRLGRTRLRDRADDEVRYYTQQNRKFPAVWDIADEDNQTDFEMVEAPYGQWDLEVMDAHGGWTSTAADLVRFAAAIDSELTPLLTPESMQLLQQAPAFGDTASRGVWYGLGWNVRPIGPDGSASLWHMGALAGTSTLLVRRWDGFTWAVLFNCDKAKSGERCADLVDGPLHRAIDESVKIENCRHWVYPGGSPAFAPGAWPVCN